MIAWALRKADRVVVVSKELGDLAGKMGVPKKKTVYIPNGVDTRFFHPNVSGKYDYDALFFGGIKWQKGLDYLVDAIKTLKGYGINVRVAIAGNGPYLQELVKRIHSRNIEGDVFILGELDIYRLREVIWRSKIIIFPSVSEGLPCSLLEAMACSKPMIATSVGGMKEVIKNEVNGILVPPRNSEAIAKSIVRLLRDGKTLSKLSEKARETIIGEYTWEKISEKSQILL